MAGGVDVSAGDQQYDRMEMLKAFDQTEAGVKGLIDSGLTKIPKIFVRPSEDLAQELPYKNIQIQVPVVDLSGILDADGRKQIVEQVRIASETWGFFQVVNHGISPTVLDGMIDGIRKFNEMDVEEKRRYYSRDYTRRVRYSSNFDLFASKTANWRDTLSISFSDLIDSEELPASCRDSTMEYSNRVKILGKTLFELLSEALGLSPDHLNNMECSKVHQFSCHYYPACPEPQLTLEPANTLTLDSSLFFYKVKSVASRFCIKITGLTLNPFQELVSNGRFISNKHRVTANSIGPRISVACFFSGPVGEVKTYGPIKELISEENPAKYRDLLLTEYVGKFLKTGLDDEIWGIDYCKL
ncbi:UNVERIFIED_CONTAM: 1-aminocyclopropane-1-carboxylate oxidase1 [Sesamum calycinum]|uniref:1-aminocyclopropane-1-carboxylate oxidase1 n=1 Tax=Sesamum calycinum TaxID=2727403 RepID=A0AAW2R9Y6_9LAMI